jgi:hypothetical protein
MPDETRPDAKPPEDRKRKERRLAEALRENLGRRKAQGRERRSEPGDTAPTGGGRDKDET